MLFSKPVSLTEEERKTPLEMLGELHVDYKFYEHQEFVSTIVEVCLTTENDEFSNPIDRSDLLNQGRHLLKVLEICSLLVKQSSQEK